MAIDTDIHDQAAAYALDALDGVERRAFEAHLESCDRCRAEVASFEEAVLALADGGDAAEPPPGLRERLLVAARADFAARTEPAPVVSLGAARKRRYAERLLRPKVLAPAFAVAAAAAVALAVWGAGISDSLDRERSARRADAEALAAFADPSAARTATGNAALVVAGGRGALSLAKLPPAPAGKTYQAWVIPPGKEPIPAGLFAVSGGRAVVILVPTVGRGAVVAVTLEPAGGVSAPSGPPLLAVKTSTA